MCICAVGGGGGGFFFLFSRFIICYFCVSGWCSEKSSLNNYTYMYMYMHFPVKLNSCMPYIIDKVLHLHVCVPRFKFIYLE